MIWVAIILLFLAIAVSPFMLIGLVIMVIWVGAKSWIYPSDENDADKPKPLREYYSPYDPVKPWNPEGKPQKKIYLEDKPWTEETEETFYEPEELDDVWVQYHNDVQNTKDLALALKGNVAVEPDFWEDWGLDFQCNLIGYGTELRLNYEIIDRENKIPWEEDPGFWLQTNFYDADNNLLYCLEYDINMDALKQRHVTDYCLFDVSEFPEATHVLVYGYRVY